MKVPVLQTTRAWSAAELSDFSTLGYEAIQYQAQNGATTKDFNLAPAVFAGLRPELWGVTYNQGDFRRDGRLLGAQGKKLGAVRVCVNAEMCAKFTRGLRGMRAVVEGIREGGFIGPVDLSTLGSPFNPDLHDFEIDVQSFLETGGSIYAQAYVNAHSEYHPANCVRYWTRMGVPKDRLNLTLGLYDATSEGGRRMTGAEYVAMAKDLGMGRAFSVFMPETALLPSDLTELHALTASPPPPASVDIHANRLEAMRLNKEAIDFWRANGLSEETIAIQRQTSAWRVLQLVQSGKNLRGLRAYLDAAGAPKP